MITWPTPTSPQQQSVNPESFSSVDKRASCLRSSVTSRCSGARTERLLYLFCWCQSPGNITSCRVNTHSTKLKGCSGCRITSPHFSFTRMQQGIIENVPQPFLQMNPRLFFYLHNRIRVVFIHTFHIIGSCSRQTDSDENTTSSWR